MGLNALSYMVGHPESMQAGNDMSQLTSLNNQSNPAAYQNIKNGESSEGKYIKFLPYFVHRQFRCEAIQTE